MTSNTVQTLAAAGGAALLASAASAKTADDLLKEISTYQFGQSREPLTQVEDWVRINLGSPELSQAIANTLAGLLSTSATKDCKLFVCRQLAVIGTDENVPVIAALLANAETADMARYALQRMQSPSVDTALLAALDGAGDAATGIINTLGERRSAGAAKALASFVTSDNAKVAEAAIAALGKIGGAKSAKVLAQAQGNVAPGLRRSVSDAQLAIAASCAEAGDAATAKAIYRSLTGEDEEAPVRKAAELGLASMG
ncbi:MAG: HEAT repeat domain-containing protein [Candidatus Hydrogenedentes bacterium]|nr:HEAT repeat domain-containing protein [Candidatus Hydrogenedentota bacterium]